MNQYTKGVIVGSLIGAAYSLLNAPDSGKNTRLKIKTYFTDLKASQKQVQKDLNKLQKSVNHLTTDGIQSALEFTEDLTTRMATFQKEALPQLEKIKGLVINLQNDLDADQTIEPPIN